MSKLEIRFKDGSTQNYEDITFCEPRILEDMNKDGEMEPVRDGLYFERESDEIGCGTLIDSDQISEYELDGQKTILTNDHKTIMDGEVWKTETDQRWITEDLEGPDLDER